MIRLFSMRINAASSFLDPGSLKLSIMFLSEENLRKPFSPFSIYLPNYFSIHRYLWISIWIDTPSIHVYLTICLSKWSM